MQYILARGGCRPPARPRPGIGRIIAHCRPPATAFPRCPDPKRTG